MSHSNTGRLLGDEHGRKLMARVAGDEALHHVFYRDAMRPCWSSTRPPRSIAIDRVVREFAMPGTAIPNFNKAAQAIAAAGIYDFASHHGSVLVPVVIDAWHLDELKGSRRGRAGPRPLPQVRPPPRPRRRADPVAPGRARPRRRRLDKQRGGQLRPRRFGYGDQVLLEHLHAHVVGAGVEVRLAPGPRRVDVAPGDDGVDSRSLPPSAKSSSLKPSRRRLFT